MWFALSMLLLFVGYCWLDSSNSPFLPGVERSNASDSDSEEWTGLTEMFDESRQTERENNQGWHDMGFMTHYHLLPTKDQD